MTPLAGLGSGRDVVRNDLESITRRTAAEFDTMSGDSLLLVGGGGFLGYYLIQAVLAWNDTGRGAPIWLTVFDNWMRGMPVWLEDVSDRDDLSVETVDIVSPLPPDTPHYDWIVHAASIASPTYYRQHPIETMDVNVKGLRNLLEYGLAQQRAKSPLKGFLFFSTSEVYGDPPPESIPTPESFRGNVSFTGPRACYDESKRFGETLSVSFARVHDLPVKIVRPFNNYGPGLGIQDRRVIPDFARDILAGRDVVMHSPGSPTRTFCYISDAVVGYYEVLVGGMPGEAYNIGADAPEVSIADLARRITAIAASELGYDGSVVHQESQDPDYLVDNPSRRCPMIDKARAELGFEPTVGLDEGLRRSLLWYRDLGRMGAEARP